jgi:hypothetical protein
MPLAQNMFSTTFAREKLAWVTAFGVLMETSLSAAKAPRARAASVKTAANIVSIVFDFWEMSVYIVESDLSRDKGAEDRKGGLGGRRGGTD